MKTKFIAAFAILITTFSFAQKKELKDAEKAIKKNNFAEAKIILRQLDPNSMEDKYKANFYYLNAEALYANGSANNDDEIGRASCRETGCVCVVSGCASESY